MPPASAESAAMGRALARCTPARENAWSELRFAAVILLGRTDPRRATAVLIREKREFSCALPIQNPLPLDQHW
jgi:hypothetical protein